MPWEGLADPQQGFPFCAQACCKHARIPWEAGRRQIWEHHREPETFCCQTPPSNQAPLAASGDRWGKKKRCNPTAEKATEGLQLDHLSRSLSAFQTHLFYSVGRERAQRPLQGCSQLRERPAPPAVSRSFGGILRKSAVSGRQLEKAKEVKHAAWLRTAMFPRSGGGDKPLSCDNNSSLGGQCSGSWIPVCLQCRQTAHSLCSFEGSPYLRDTPTAGARLAEGSKASPGGGSETSHCSLWFPCSPTS